MTALHGASWRIMAHHGAARCIMHQQPRCEDTTRKWRGPRASRSRGRHGVRVLKLFIGQNPYQSTFHVVTSIQEHFSKCPLEGSRLPIEVRTSVVRLSVVRTSVVRTSVVRTSVERTSVERTSVVRTSVVRTSVVRLSVVRTSVVRTSVVRTSVVRTSVVCTSVVRTSAVRTSIVRTSAVRTSVGSCLESGALITSCERRPEQQNILQREKEVREERGEKRETD
ncbi:Serum response factor-binding protein 1 [Liparis tanakae]|uniref:Serum response factor-binding protein 1 n=1 Tax=Liparis tanakae TaxID=230148 RepID=A0A4Z2EWT5_9TELE|nr:Serum response factor-binding protein 1 [Liparis tanakae]